MIAKSGEIRAGEPIHYIERPSDREMLMLAYGYILEKERLISEKSEIARRLKYYLFPEPAIFGSGVDLKDLK